MKVKANFRGLLPVSVAYKYAIDVFSSRYISGWCFHRFDKNKPLILEFKSGTILLGECQADVLREDLQKQALHPSGLCGFSFVFPDQARLTREEETDDISISIKDSRHVLCVLDKKLADKVAGRATHPFSRIKQRLSMTPASFDKVLFMHIPKTAGTTFNTFAKSSYPPNRAMTHIEFFAESDYAQIARDNYFISGHLNIGQLQQSFSFDQFKVYTLMREPYAQLHSHINWLRGIARDKNSAFYQSHHGLFKTISESFIEKETLTADDLRAIVSNLSGVLMKLLDNNQTRYFQAEECTIIEHQHLIAAEKNLSNFENIGTTERYEQFRQIFCDRHHFRYTPGEHSFNSSQYAPLYDHQNALNQEILRPLVKHDLALYQKVMDTF